YGKKKASAPLDPSLRDFYFAPYGEFDINVDSAKKGTHLLLCGLTGTEYLRFTPEHVKFQFVTGQAAFIDEASNTLNNAITTSYVMLKGQSRRSRNAKTAPRIEYSVQPEDAALYISAGNNTSLKYHDPAQSMLDEVPPVPIVPLSGIADDKKINSLLNHERFILAKLRKEKLIEKSQQLETVNDELTVATTAQGLIVEISGAKWTNLKLGKGDYDNTFLQVQGELKNLQEVLQQPRTFAVISDFEVLGDFTYSKLK